MRILYLEPFHGGSHRQFGRTLLGGIEADWTAVTLPGRHWKWRMRGAAAHMALARADDLTGPFELVFASSYVALAELHGLVPHLAEVPSILYFHENQLAYPGQGERETARDHHFGFTQLVSALAATRCVFNSGYNRDSFLDEGAKLLARMPDAVPPGWVDCIRDKSVVLGVPLELETPPRCAYEAETDGQEREAGPIVLWNHRWEHDKGPERFFAVLDDLARRELPFRVAVCGEQFRNSPSVFEEARSALGDRIVQWGHLGSRTDYLALLRRTHIAVSTARHEFFGISMLEATWYGAHPLVPDGLSFAELFPDRFRYATQDDLAGRLAHLVEGWSDDQIDLRDDRTEIVRPHLARALLPRYEELFEQISSERRRR